MNIFIWIAVILFILFLIFGLAGVRRIPSKILDMKFVRLIMKNTTLGIDYARSSMEVQWLR